MIAAALVPLVALSLLVGPGATSATSGTAATLSPVADQLNEPCTVEDATLTWGFKETFRSYISGTIANGEWTVSEGATYETPNFEFTGGTGVYGEAESSVAFAGAIRFTGHGGILDTTVANPRIEWSGTSGVLYLDVSGTTQEGDPVDERSVNFATLVMPGPGSDPDPKVFNGVSATLTEQGAAAFGTYDPGEPLDAITLDLGVVDDTVEESCSLLSVTPQRWLSVGIAVALGIFVVVGLVVVVFRVRRRRPASPPA